MASRPLLLFASLHGLASAQHTYPSRYTALWNSPWPADCQAGGVPPRWSDYNISTNRNSSFMGQTVATIYKAGNYPMFRGMGPGGACADGDWNCTAATSVFGGLPQLANLTSHLEQLAHDIAAILPDPAWSGVANIDWEAWSPEFANNRYNEYWIYVNRSEALVRQQQPAWPASQVAAEAERQFNAAAQSFWVETLRTCKKLRPHGVWGYYNYPVNSWDPASASDERLDWLWDEVTALFPSVYLLKHDADSNRAYVDKVLNQTRAVRDARFARTGDVLPMYSFTWYDYDISPFPPLSFLSPTDLESEMVRGATRWGLSGTLVWGASADARNATRCGTGAGSLTSYIDESLGPALLKASAAANACADARCSGRGRCWGAAGGEACDCDKGWSEADCSKQAVLRPFDGSNAAVAAAQPHLSGIFVFITSTTANWTSEQWETDLAAMQAVGMTFAVLPQLARQVKPPDAKCPLGYYAALFNATGLGECFSQKGTAEQGGTVETVLKAAASLGMKLQLGLATNGELVTHDPGYNSALAKEYAWLQWQVAERLFGIATDMGLAGSVAGFYTEVEEYNAAWWLGDWDAWAEQYLGPVSTRIKSLRSDLIVWASPYSVGNMTRFEPKNIINFKTYGAIWGQVFDWAPNLDLVSPQDSMGAQGNSYENASDCLGNVTLGGMHAQRPRTTWSNVELFETWPPPPCQYPNCTGRHPAPFERFQKQIENEWGVLQSVGGIAEPVLIAWEWYSCLSPNGGADNRWANETKANYELYKAWVLGH